MTIDGKPFKATVDQFNRGTDEAFYGLGQHQKGQMDYIGEDIELAQHNTDIAVPFALSTRNYGLPWYNNSITRFGNPKPNALAGEEGLMITGDGGKPGFTARFGLINREGIRKPAYFAYKYLNMLRGREVPLGDDQSLAATADGRTGALVWTWQQPEQKISNRPFFTKVLPARPMPAAEIRFSGLVRGSYRLTVRRTGFHANDAHTRYLEMGSPARLSQAQLDELQDLTRDLPETSRAIHVGADGHYSLRVSMRSNDVILAMLDPARNAGGK